MTKHAPSELELLRRLSRMTQREVAAATGLDEPAICRLETGSRRVTPSILAALRRLYGERIAELEAAP